MAEDPERPWFVQDDEEIQLTAKPGNGYVVALFLKIIVPVSVLFAAAWFALRRFGDRLDPAWTSGFDTYALLVYLVVLVLAGIFAWRRQVTSLYVITDKRLYAKRGRLRMQLDFTSHDRVSDVHYNRGIWDKLTGVGDVRFATAGDDVSLPGVSDPSSIQAAATNARDAFVERLLERAGLDSAEAIPTAGTAEETTTEPGVEVPGETTDEEPRPVRGGIDPASEGLAPYEGETPSYVRGAEEVRWMGKPTKRNVLESAGGTLLGLPVLLLFVLPSFPELGSMGALIVPVLIAFLVVPLAYQWLRLDRTELAITDERVYLRQGVLSTNVNQVAYEKITDITYNESFAGRLLGYATIEVNTSGSTTSPIQVPGLTEGLAVKRLLEKASGAADA